MSSFDELTKKFAAGASRRDALKIMAAGAVATMMAPLAGGSALAAAPDGYAKKACAGQPFGTQCRSNCSGLGCYCGHDVTGTKDLCFVNEYCYNATPCSSNHQCGTGSFCLEADNGCGQGVCVKKCGKTTPCVPGKSRGAGMVVA